MPIVTLVKVRVQANGGKYLGAAVPRQPQVTATWAGATTGTPIPAINSGIVCASQSPAASPNPIVVPSCAGKGYKPGTYWLLPPGCDPFTDSMFIFQLPLEGTVDVTFTATAYAPQDVMSPPLKLRLTAGVDYTRDPGVVLLVPGLLLTNSSFDGQNVSLHVAMMCGCQITPTNMDRPAAEPYWPACDFEVKVQDLNYPSNQAVLTCTDPATPSLFRGKLPVRARPDTKVTVTARQLSTGNTNTLRLM